MKKNEMWETIVIILGVLALWPVVHWYNAKKDVPFLYVILLVTILAALAFITVRRVKRLRRAIRDAKNRRRQFPF